MLHFFFFNHPSTTEIYTLSLHDALPISQSQHAGMILEQVAHHQDLVYPIGEFDQLVRLTQAGAERLLHRSEEHTSELQSHSDLVCRLLLEKKKKNNKAKSNINKKSDIKN